MDPNTSTREQFTQYLLSQPIPSHAAPVWREVVENLKALLDKLAHHPAMSPNLQQTYMTPAASKNRVYFVWDFVGRTLGMLYAVDPSVQRLSTAKKELWEGAQGRASFSGMLITNALPGALNEMTEAAYPDQEGAHPEFGDDIIAIARRLSGS
ncbi:hypothetical protein B0A49_01473 [Cryomyces minteri]|uniref:Uncharacterized protein n=1 Tax=Cryomyces minteri TaxID=331657 RepID=A0A4U0XSW0_9PEZI|nr:hypothetical protein B0A49_01473 [Cryomyces minteri]